MVLFKFPLDIIFYSWYINEYMISSQSKQYLHQRNQLISYLLNNVGIPKTRIAEILNISMATLSKYFPKKLKGGEK